MMGGVLMWGSLIVASPFVLLSFLLLFMWRMEVRATQYWFEQAAKSGLVPGYSTIPPRPANLPPPQGGAEKARQSQAIMYPEEDEDA